MHNVLFTQAWVLDNGNCRLTMPIFKGHGAHILLHGITKICNSTTIIHAYNESLNVIDISTVHFDISGLLNLIEMVLEFGMKGTMSHPCLCYTWNYLMQGICSLMKPPAVEKFMPFPTQIRTIILWCWTVYDDKVHESCFCFTSPLSRKCIDWWLFLQMMWCGNCHIVSINWY